MSKINRIQQWVPTTFTRSYKILRRPFFISKIVFLMFKQRFFKLIIHFILFSFTSVLNIRQLKYNNGWLFHWYIYFLICLYLRNQITQETTIQNFRQNLTDTYCVKVSVEDFDQVVTYNWAKKINKNWQLLIDF